MVSNKNWKAVSHSAIVNLCLIEDTQVQAALGEREDKVSISMIDAGHVRYVPLGLLTQSRGVLALL
jgi:hypothetical protein